MTDVSQVVQERKGIGKYLLQVSVAVIVTVTMIARTQAVLQETPPLSVSVRHVSDMNAPCLAGV